MILVGAVSLLRYRRCNCRHRYQWCRLTISNRLRSPSARNSLAEWLRLNLAAQLPWPPAGSRLNNMKIRRLQRGDVIEVHERGGVYPAAAGCIPIEGAG